MQSTQGPRTSVNYLRVRSRNFANCKRDACGLNHDTQDQDHRVRKHTINIYDRKTKQVRAPA